MAGIPNVNIEFAGFADIAKYAVRHNEAYLVSTSGKILTYLSSGQAYQSTQVRRFVPPCNVKSEICNTCAIEMGCCMVIK